MSERTMATPGTLNTVLTLIAARKRKETLLFVAFFSTVLVLTPLLILGGVKVGFSLLLAGIAVLCATIAIARWPLLGFYAVAVCVFLIEQEPLANPDLTDKIDIFHWPTQLAGFIERPIGLLLIFTLLFWLIQRFARRQPLLRGGALIFPLSLFMLCVVGGALYGLISGGSFKIIVVQIRPFWYLFLSYLAAYNFVTRKEHIRTFFWLAILLAAVKALQCLYIYFSVYHGRLTNGVDTVLAHEESFFWAALLLLVVIFFMCYRYRPQLYVALVLVPVVVMALVANDRRTDFVALLVGVGVACVLSFLIRPKARTKLLVSFFIFSTLGAAYVIAFAHSTGIIGEPARAIISVINPSSSDTRDITSNLYRVFENNDLKFTIKQYPLGIGFGKAFLQPEPLTALFPGISLYDPYYNYVPHNTIYWVWIDLGPVGYLAFWLLIGAIIVRGCIIARKLRDPYLQVVTIYIVAVTFMEVVVAYADYQLFFYRNVIYVGLLCGILMKLPALDQQEQRKSKEVPVNETANGLFVPPPPLVGSGHA